MNKKTSNFFTMFWFIVGAGWLAGLFRQATVGDNISRMYIVAAGISFILALIFCRNSK